MSGESRNEVPDDSLAAEYVLGTLPHEQRMAFVNRLRTDPVLAMAVRRWEARFLPLTEEIEPIEPPESVYAAVEQKLFDGTEKPVSWWTSLNLWQAVSAVSLAAVVLLGALLIHSVREPDRNSPTLVSRLAGNPDIVQLVAAYDPSRSVLKLNRTRGMPANGRDFELWLIGGGNPPVSLGVIGRERISQLHIPADLARLMDNAVLAISDEPAGGSRTGQPTGAVLATGELVRL